MTRAKPKTNLDQFNLESIKSVSVAEFCRLMQIGTRTGRRIIANREIETLRVGRRVVIPITAIKAYRSKITVPAYEPGSHGITV